MKNLLISLSILILAVSCGKEDSSSNLTDGISLGDHRVFVTSTDYTGAEIGGVSGADTKCHNAKVSAGLKLTYKAILSDDDDGTNNYAKTRLVFTGAVYTVDSNAKSNLVAAAGADLWTSGTTNLLNLINIDEKGSTTAGTPWTGATDEGGAIGDDCSGWTSSISNGEYGNTENLDAQWIENNSEACSNPHPLFCISQ